MPNSLKCRLKKLANQDLLSEKDLSRIYTDNDVIEKLEKIKDEIGIYYADCSLSISENDENCRRCNDTMFGSVLGIVDKHISELKRE